MPPDHDELIRNTYTSDIGFAGSLLAKVIVGFMCLSYSLAMVWYFDYLTVAKTITSLSVIVTGAIFMAIKQTSSNRSKLNFLLYCFITFVVVNQVVEHA